MYLQGHGNLDKPLHHLILRQEFALLLFEFVVEVSPLAEAHHNVEVAIVPLPGLSVGDDVGVSQLGQKLCLLLCCSPLAAGSASKV